MPDAGLTDEEIEQILSGCRADDAADRAREAERVRQERAELEALDGEVEDMLEGHIIGGVVDAAERARRAERDQRIRREQNRLAHQHWQRRPQGNLVNVAGQVMQVIEAGQLWQHQEESNIQLRVVNEGDDTVIVAPVGISAHAGLPTLFRLTIKVFTREFRHVSDQRWSLEADRDQAEEVLVQLSAEKDKPEPEPDVERQTIWERLMGEDDSLG